MSRAICEDCSSVVNCAIWAMNEVSSVGLSGSCFVSCTVMSFRKSSWPRVCFGTRSVAGPEASVAGGVLELLVMVMAIRVGF